MIQRLFWPLMLAVIVLAVANLSAYYVLFAPLYLAQPGPLASIGFFVVFWTSITLGLRTGIALVIKAYAKPDAFNSLETEKGLWASVKRAYGPDAWVRADMNNSLLFLVLAWSLLFGAITSWGFFGLALASNMGYNFLFGFLRKA